MANRSPDDSAAEKREEWESRVPEGEPGPGVFRWIAVAVSSFDVPPRWFLAVLLACLAGLLLADTAGWI